MDDDFLFDDEDGEDIVKAINEFGEEEEFIIIDSIVHNDTNYILVVNADSEDDDEEIDGLVLKETTQDGEQSVFTVITDEMEIFEVSSLFKSNDEFDIKL